MQELADLIGTSQQQVDRLEKGQRKLTAEWMEKFGQALDCKPAELFDFTSAEPAKTAKVETAIAKVMGAIETRFSNQLREFTEDEKYEISFKPPKKDLGKKFFALVVEGGSFKNYPENSELIFAQTKITPLKGGLSENTGDFIASPGKNNAYKFELKDKLIEGYLVKSLRSE